MKKLWNCVIKAVYLMQKNIKKLNCTKNGFFLKDCLGYFKYLNVDVA